MCVQCDLLMCVLEDTANIQFELLHNPKLKSQDFRGGGGETSLMDGLNLDRLKTFIQTLFQQIVMTIYIFEISLFSAVIAKC